MSVSLNFRQAPTNVTSNLQYKVSGLQYKVSGLQYKVTDSIRQEHPAPRTT